MRTVKIRFSKVDDIVFFIHIVVQSMYNMGLAPWPGDEYVGIVPIAAQPQLPAEE